VGAECLLRSSSLAMLPIVTCCLYKRFVIVYVQYAVRSPTVAISKAAEDYTMAFEARDAGPSINSTWEGKRALIWPFSERLVQ